jgi:putative N6-adenine-specific DNA methylase
MEKQNYIAKTLFGLEEVLMKELNDLGIKDCVSGNRSISFSATKEELYRANVWLRTAIRILKPITSFQVLNEAQLYEEIKKIDWEKYMSVDDTLAVDSVVYSSVFTHSLYISQKTKDAIADQFREKYDKRPSVDLEHPTLRVHIYISKEECSVSIDTSGESLHKRGYRSYGNEAPLNEALAAGLILLSNWDRKSNFVDFMCGSGTFLIEAALIAKNIPPGVFRKEFGFERWKDHDPELLGKILKEAFDKRIEKLDFEIIGSDISSKSCRIAKENISNAELDNDIKIFNKSFEELTPPAPGIVISNPPYGERLEMSDDLYKTIGDTLKKKYQDYQAWILSCNLEAVKSVGLKPSRRIPIMNSQLDCRFINYSMYSGSKKVKPLE